MGLENDLCVCGHDRDQHQHLLGTKVRYRCLNARALILEKDSC